MISKQVRSSSPSLVVQLYVIRAVLWSTTAPSTLDQHFVFSRERVKAPNALWVDMDWQWDATKVEGATVSVPVGRVRPQHGAAL